MGEIKISKKAEEIDLPYINEWLQKYNITWDQLLRNITLTILNVNRTKRTIIDIEIIDDKVRTLIEDNINEITKVREMNPDIYHPEIVAGLLEELQGYKQNNKKTEIVKIETETERLEDRLKTITILQKLLEC